MSTIDTNQIVVYYQPICDNSNLNARPNKFEALLRYPSEDGNYTFPFEAFKNLNFIEKFKCTMYMLNEITQILKKYSEYTISLNIAYSDISTEKFRNTLLQHLTKSKCADRIVLEFVEEEELENTDVVNKFINDAKALGCRFSLDDFGKKYATFDPLLKYDFDYLKFDKVLIENFTADPKKFYILDMLISLCHRLKIETIAEHIETDEALASVSFIGCTYSQGFHQKLGQPAPIV